MKKSKSKTKTHRTHAGSNDVQTLTIRIDLERQDKADLDYLCHSLGINIQIAVRIFLAQMLQVGGLPFDVKSKEFNPDYPPETIEALQETLDIEAGKIPAKRYHSAQELFEANNAEIAASEKKTTSSEKDTESEEDTASEEDTESENENAESEKSENTTYKNFFEYALSTDIGTFDDVILADLLDEGYGGKNLLVEFKIRRNEIRPVVDKLLKQVDEAINSIGNILELRRENVRRQYLND